MKELSLRVPLLTERPVIESEGGSASAADVIRSELGLLAGAEEIRVDQPAGQVALWYDPEQLDAEEICAVVTRIGYPVPYGGEAGA